MYHLYHGYVSHNQMVDQYIIILLSSHYSPLWTIEITIFLVVRSRTKNLPGPWMDRIVSKPIAAAAQSMTSATTRLTERCHLKKTARAPCDFFSGDRKWHQKGKKPGKLESESGMISKGFFEYFLMETIPKTMPKSVFRGGGFMLQWSLIQIFRFVTFLSFWIFLGGCYMEKLVHSVAVSWAMFFFVYVSPRINCRYCFRSQRHQIWGQLQEINLGWSRFDIVRRGVHLDLFFFVTNMEISLHKEKAIMGQKPDIPVQEMGEWETHQHTWDFKQQYRTVMNSIIELS